MKGTVKFFHDQNGYGFIKTDALDDDVYVNVEDQEDGFEIEEGDEVEFEKEDADKGPKAVNVTKV